MELTSLKEAGLQGMPAVIAFVLLWLGKKLFELIEAKVGQAPAMQQFKLQSQTQADTAAGTVLTQVLDRLKQTEARMDEISKAYADCERRSAALVAALRAQGVAIPPDLS